MKINKSILLAFILGVVITGSIGAVALNINANEISYNDTTVDSALNTLYNMASGNYTSDIVI